MRKLLQMNADSQNESKEGTVIALRSSRTKVQDILMRESNRQDMEG